MKLTSSISAFLVCVMLFACNKNDSSNGNTPPSGSSNTISISGFAFKSSTLTVAAGTTITWTNNDAAAHTVTADDDSYKSSTLNQGATYSHTYTAAGTYTYHCQFHTMMKGTITVQ